SLAEAGMTEMRALIFELRPESIEQEGLVIALGKQASSVQARHAIHVMTEFCEEPALPIETKEGLYRIAREALHNAVKHAQATEVWLSFLHTSDGYALELVDNGNGFDVSKSFPGHLGLKSMRERTEALDGQLEIESTEGKGTRIMVKIPS
ncbi:MAG: sensor histidine kinase, partial [Chloroflexota bacterium]